MLHLRRQSFSCQDVGMRTRAPSSRTADKPYHHGNLRETLLDAADALLSERGVAALTLREVAKSAGVSHAAPYHHFASLNELLAAVAERAFTTLAQAMERAVRADDPAERLIAICESYVAYALQHPAQFRLMFGPMLAHKREHPGFQQAAERAFGVLLQATTEYDPSHGVVLALTGWSVAHGLSNLLIDGAFDDLPVPVPNAKSLYRQMALRILAGSAPPQAAARGAPRQKRSAARAQRR
jgi:AcrR family transcriptional regulator